MNRKEKLDSLRKLYLLWEQSDIVLDRYNNKEISAKTMNQSMKYLSRQIRDSEAEFSYLGS